MTRESLAGHFSPGGPFLITAAGRLILLLHLTWSPTPPMSRMFEEELSSPHCGSSECANRYGALLVHQARGIQDARRLLCLGLRVLAPIDGTKPAAAEKSIDEAKRPFRLVPVGEAAVVAVAMRLDILDAASNATAVSPRATRSAPSLSSVSYASRQ